jgi:hypothetical protein
VEVDDAAGLDLVPLEIRIRLVTCGSSGYQAARAYSLIRPPRLRLVEAISDERTLVVADGT